MSSVPRTPARGNWIWLASGLLAVTVLTGAAFRYSGPGCPAAGRSAGAVAAGRLAPPAQQNPASTAGSRASSAGSRASSAGSAAGGDRGAAGAAEGAAGPGGSAARPGAGEGRGTPAVAVYYDPGDAVGSCSLGPLPADGHYVSLPPEGYAGSAACGSYLDVRGPRGRVVAEVVDLCPGCAADMINLSRAAFDRVADPGPGSARVTYWPAVDPPLPGPIVLRAGESAAGQLTLQILNTGNRLASVTLTAAADGPTAAPHPLALGDHDLWVSSEPLGTGPFTVRITDDRRHQAVIPGVTLGPGTVIRTRTWMYRTTPARANGTPAAGAVPASGAGPAGSPTAGRSSAAGRTPSRLAAPARTPPAAASC